jgi:hypothetical protein
MLGELFNVLKPPHPLDYGGESTPLYQSKLRAWHWRVNNTLLIVVCILGTLIAAALPGGIPMLGSLAWAGDTENKIEAAVNPIKSAIDKVEQQTREIKEQQKAKELADLRQKLFETRIAQCKARAQKGFGDSGSNPYSLRMGELQALHFGLTSTYYNPSDCADL